MIIITNICQLNLGNNPFFIFYLCIFILAQLSHKFHYIRKLPHEEKFIETRIIENCLWIHYFIFVMSFQIHHCKLEILLREGFQWIKYMPLEKKISWKICLCYFLHSCVKLVFEYIFISILKHTNFMHVSYT